MADECEQRINNTVKSDAVLCYCADKLTDTSPNIGILQNKFDELITQQWEHAKDHGVFNYTLGDGDIKRRVLDGCYNLIAFLNIKRGTQKRKGQSVSKVNTPFDPKLFNFTKIHPREVLFELCRHSNANSANCNDCKAKNKDGAHLVIINASPIMEKHFLLVPFSSQQLPQVLNLETINFGLEIALLSTSRNLFIGFNSLLAYASVNHFHYHGFYLDAPYPSFKCGLLHLKSCCYELDGSPIRGFLFTLCDQNLNKLSKAINCVVQYFIDNEIPHNMAITKMNHFTDGVNITDNRSPLLNVYLWPKQPSYGAKVGNEIISACYEQLGFFVVKGGWTEEFNTACVEVGGFMPMRDEEEYENFTEERAVRVLEKYSLSKQEFQDVKTHILPLIES